MLGRGNVWSSPRVVVIDPGKPPLYLLRIPLDTRLQHATVAVAHPGSPTTEWHQLVASPLAHQVACLGRLQCPSHFTSQGATAHLHAAPPPELPQLLTP